MYMGRDKTTRSAHTPTVLTPVVTWPSEESNSRILPVTDRAPISPFFVFPMDVSSVDFGWKGDTLSFVGLTQENISQIRKFVPESERIDPEVVAAAAGPKQELRA